MNGIYDWRLPIADFSHILPPGGADGTLLTFDLYLLTFDLLLPLPLPTGLRQEAAT